MPGKSLRVFVTGESPRSIKKITEFNWSGHAFYGTREQLKQIYSRSESENTGIYFLLSDINTDMVQMYVGETENFSKRIRNHNKNKDWWTHFIVFQSESSSLNKAHVRYLEYIFWKRGSDSTQIELMNEQSPKEPKLSEEDVADLKVFEENILYILEAMNLSYFTNYGSQITGISLSGSIDYQMNVPKSDFEAKMTVQDDKYILKAGSYLRLVPAESFVRGKYSYYKKWRRITNSDIVEKIDDETGRLNTDLEFTSASAAAAVVKGRSTNGLTSWKNIETGLSIKEEFLEQEPEKIAS